MRFRARDDGLDILVAHPPHDIRIPRAALTGTRVDLGHTDVSSPARLAAALADRYRLDRELGQGGMATVYLARDLKHDRHK